MKRIIKWLVWSVLISVQIQAQVTSQWRGDNRTGVFNEKDLLEEWPENGPELIWSVDGIGEGYSSASVTDELIVLTGLIDTIEYVTALDLDGNQLWQTEFGPGWITSFEASRSTPTVVHDLIYVIGGQGHIACLNSKTGDIVWKLEAYKKFEGEWDIWGVAESPLYHDGHIYITSGYNHVGVMLKLNEDILMAFDISDPPSQSDNLQTKINLQSKKLPVNQHEK